MNAKKQPAGRGRKTPERETRTPTGRKPKASQQRRTTATAGAEGQGSGPGPEGRRSAPLTPSSSAGRPSRGPRAGASSRPRAQQAAAPSLDAPRPDAQFRDRDGQPHSFPDSSLKRVAARLLSERKKPWRYRPFSFPLFTQTGREQTFTPDFVVYDHQDAVLRVVIVAARDSAELWDRLGRLKRQYPMYPAELWTPEKLAQLTRPRARLGF